MDEVFQYPCRHGMEKKYNSIGEKNVYCDLTAEWMNVDLGDCIGNCDAYSAVECVTKEAVHQLIAQLKKFVWTSPVSTETHITVDADDVDFGVDRLPATTGGVSEYASWIYGQCTYCSWEEPDFVQYDGYEPERWKHTKFCPNCGRRMIRRNKN